MSQQPLRNWLHQVDLDGGRRHDGLTSSEQEELRRLRRENRVLREEREILAKASSGAPSMSSTTRRQRGEEPR